MASHNGCQSEGLLLFLLVCLRLAVLVNACSSALATASSLGTPWATSASTTACRFPNCPSQRAAIGCNDVDATGAADAL